MTDDEHLAAFENRTLPFDQWNHRAHVKVAFTLLRRNSFSEALSRMRADVKAYNARHDVPESATPCDWDGEFHPHIGFHIFTTPNDKNFHFCD